jgi:non-homologous end joining protein Ku
VDGPTSKKQSRNCKVDAETGGEVDSADIIKGYEVGKGDYGAGLVRGLAFDRGF